MENQYYQKFYLVIHSNLSVDDQFISASGEKFAILKYWECRIKYCVALDFDYCGKYFRTRDIPSTYFTSIEFDKNCSPYFIAIINSPRVLSQPYDFPWYGANNYTEQLLINATLTKKIQKLGRDEDDF